MGVQDMIECVCIDSECRSMTGAWGRQRRRRGGELDWLMDRSRPPHAHDPSRRDPTHRSAPLERLHRQSKRSQIRLMVAGGGERRQSWSVGDELT